MMVMMSDNCVPAAHLFPNKCPTFCNSSGYVAVVAIDVADVVVVLLSLLRAVAADGCVGLLISNSCSRITAETTKRSTKKAKHRPAKPSDDGVCSASAPAPVSNSSAVLKPQSEGSSPAACFSLFFSFFFSFFFSSLFRLCLRLLLFLLLCPCACTNAAAAAALNATFNNDWLSHTHTHKSPRSLEIQSVGWPVGWPVRSTGRPTIPIVVVQSRRRRRCCHSCCWTRSIRGTSRQRWPCAVGTNDRCWNKKPLTGTQRIIICPVAAASENQNDRNNK